MISNRRTEIDVAKGFAIFLVIFGHVVTMHQTLFRWIFSFHMPAFFFLSGMTFRPDRYPDFRAFLADKFRKRIVPYFMIAGIALVICMLRPAYRIPILEDGPGTQLLWLFYYAQPKNLYVGQIWFLVALFMAELIAWLWLRAFDKRSLLAKCYSLLLLALAAVNIQRINGLLPFGERLPWKIDTALCAAVFLIAGYYAARENLLERLRPAAPVLIPVSIWFSYYFGPKLITYVNMCDCFYHEAPYYYTAAFCGIAAMTLTALLMKRSRFWQFCGRNTMPLFAAQTFVIYLITEWMEKVSGVVYKPMENIPDKPSLAISIAAFLVMLAVIYLVQVVRTRRRSRTS